VQSKIRFMSLIGPVLACVAIVAPASMVKAAPLKTPAANKGPASLVLFFTGDGPETLFFQETIKLKKAMEGYKKVVLLKHEKLERWADLSEADEKIADVKDVPTKAKLTNSLRDLANQGYYIDVWIIGHGQDGKFIISDGSYDAPHDSMTANEIKDLPRATGFTKLPIRMVWSTLCYGSTLNDAWKAAGAKVVGGSRFVNFYPNQFGRFAEEWNKGHVSYSEAIEKADTAQSRTVVQTYLAEIHAPSKNDKWGKCPFGSTILGDKKCAREYFTKMWLADNSDWKEGKSGKEFMNYSSAKIIAGDRAISKSSAPKW